MADEVSENQLFEILRHLKTLIIKSDDHNKRFDSIDRNFELLQEEARIFDGKITDIAAKVIGIDKRLAVVEAQLNLVETKLTSLEEEARQIRLEMNELNERAGTATAMSEQIDQLEVRVFQLEEKLAT